MKIVEQHTIGKEKNELLNEDGYVITKDYICVVDGATAKYENPDFSPTTGVFVKNIICEAISSADPDFDRAEMQNYIDWLIKTQYSDTDFYLKHPDRRLQASAVIFSLKHKEIWLFGDCSALVNGDLHHTEKVPDKINSSVRSFVLKEKILRGELKNEIIDKNLDFGREAILPFLKMQSSFANTNQEYGYFVFDGFTKIDFPIETINVSKNDTVVLATDGYPCLFDTFSKSESFLSELKNKDPLLMSEFVATKGFYKGYYSFDDRTYIKFIV